MSAEKKVYLGTAHCPVCDRYDVPILSDNFDGTITLGRHTGYLRPFICEQGSFASVRYTPHPVCIKTPEHW